MGPDPYRYGQIATITHLDGYSRHSVASVRFERDNYYADYHRYKLQPLEITPEQQQRIDDQRRRLAHADRYL